MVELNTLHIGAGLFHAIQSAYAFALVNGVDEYSEGGRFPLTNNTLLETNEIGEYKLGNVVAVFPLLSTFNHAWSVKNKDAYQKILKQGYNPIRQGEYGLSAGIMTWVIAQLSGIYDVKTLSSLVVMNGAMQWVGLESEKTKSETLNRIGFLIFMAIWIPIFVSFFSAVNSAEEEVPGIVYSIIFIMFALFLCFGVLHTLYIKGKYNFEQTEKGYLVLSLVSKTLLTNLTLFGILNADGERIRGPEPNPLRSV